MKKVKMTAAVLLTALFSANVFADGDIGLTFDLSKEEMRTPENIHYYCNVKKDNSTSILSPSKFGFFINNSANNFSNGKKRIPDEPTLSTSDIAKYCFGLTKDKGGEGGVSYSSNNESELTCYKGTGGRPEYTS